MLARADRRILAYHESIVTKLRDDPEAVRTRARANLERLKHEHPHARELLEQWSVWLDLPLEDLSSEVLHKGELGCAMRQVSPFSGLLSAAERTLVIKRFRAKEAT